MWMLELRHKQTNETLKQVFFHDKPGVFVLADYNIGTVSASALMTAGWATAVDGDWSLTEIVPMDNHREVSKKHADKWLEFAKILGQITYKPGWYFRNGIEDGRMWVQVGVTEEAEIAFDPIAGEKVPWRGAKHYLSPHMCRQEIVSTVLHAIERAEMHEVHEWFRYKGRSIYNPHLDPDALVVVAKFARNFNTRDNAMTMSDG